MTNAEQRARNIIAKRSTEQLLNDWEATIYNEDENIPTVRGWLMDELEKRNPEGFNAWLDSDDCKDENLRKYIK